MIIYFAYKYPEAKLVKELESYYIKNLRLGSCKKEAQETYSEMFKPTLPEQVMYYNLIGVL